ncbi:hypothetical protein L1987_11246 [Smallanthus sonchifolius]|uniref:Uncharacterized protein n=1 Tax=Smallanthus sonchifolius TaxID=185202 RepID=A0ACB9JAZ8_9ASTR|nr:hypothetical protein L1987_11246 [Smallanthus sonchifolius]
MIEIEQSTTELKHLGLLNEIAVRFVILLSNVYDFAKETYDDLKSADVSVENTTVSTEGQKLKELVVRIIVFVDDKFDKYAPSDAKKLVAEFQSLIFKISPLVKKLITITQTFIPPLITTTIFLLQITKHLIQNITTKSAPQAQTPLQKGPTPLVGTTISLVSDTILQEGPDLAKQAQDTTKSLVGGIPLMGNVVQSLVTNPTDLANQIINENPVLGAINSTAQNSLDTAKSLVPDTILQKGPDLANQAQDITKSLAGSIPLVGNVAQSLVTNPTDLANQIVNENIVSDTIFQKAPDSANQAQDIAQSLVGGIPLVGNAAQSLVTNPTDLANQIVNENIVSDTIFQKAPDSTNQAQDAAKSLVGGIPLVGNVAQSLVTNPTDLANQIVNENIVTDTIFQKAPDSTNQAQDITKSLVGGIPLVGNVAQSLVTNPTDLANQIVNTTNSLVNENPILGEVSASPNSLDPAKSLVSDTIFEKGPDLANQAQDTTMSLVGGIPLLGNVAQSLVTNPTDLANQMVSTTNSLDNENPILEAINLAAQNSLDTTKSLLGMNTDKGLSAVGGLLRMNKNN